jgi:hypothetical protein
MELTLTLGSEGDQETIETTFTIYRDGSIMSKNELTLSREAILGFDTPGVS